MTRRQREDPLVIAWLKLQSWLEENLRTALIVAGVVIAGAVAGVLWSRARAERLGQGNARVAEMTVTFWQGDYDKVLQLAGPVKQEFKGTAAETEALRIEGDAFFWKGEFEKAAESYQKYLKQNRTPSVVRDGVRLNLAQSLEGSGKSAEAAQLYEELARAEGPRDIVAERFVSAARAYRDANQVAKALPLYKKVYDEYPETPAARDAELAIGELEPTAR